MRHFNIGKLAHHYHDGETPEQRRAREAREWHEAELADQARGWIGGDGPFVVDTSDLMNGDHERDLGRHGR